MNFEKNFRGADISMHQGYPPKFPVTDFRKMRGYGMDFVIFKASQKNYQDPAFSFNVQAVKGILPWHPYHYYDNGKSPYIQADTYWRTISACFRDGIAWLDLEDQTPGDYAGWKHWYNFLETFQRLSGLPNTRIGIYTAYYYWTGALLSASWAQREYFHRYPLWLANYRPNPLKPDFENINVPNPFDDDDCLIVQTGTPVIGEACGVSSEEIDLDWFNGSREEFRKVFPIAADVSINIRS